MMLVNNFNLSVTWVGINDWCVYQHLSIPLLALNDLWSSAYVTKEGVQGLVEDLLNAQKDLYDVGARNFLFIDLPTIHRAPAGMKHPR
jgi:hypothetical protein